MRALPSDDPLRTAAGYSTPLPSMGPAASIAYTVSLSTRPRRPTLRLPHSLLPRTPVPLAQRLSRAPRIPCVCSAYRRSPSSPSLPGTPRPSSAGFRPHLSTPAPRCISCQVYTTTGVPSARNGRSCSRACHSLPPRSLRRLRPHSTPSLHPPLSRNTTRSLSVVCSICSTG
ncbi:hypothetical protein B0H14DRAFT_995283 [Mycena olivaceomarginata]|nr:hypothetical protein B0H14DRAFT_995283 [Mycena olivaceomarginata]